MVRIDLGRICANVEEIRRRVGVPVLAVVKADAYGLGLEQVLASIDSLVDGYCVFSLAEAAEARIFARTGKTSIAFSPAGSHDAHEFVEQGVRPAVWTPERAEALKPARPVLAVDTGMQRFACPPEWVEQVLSAGRCDEAFTHATALDQVARLLEVVGERGLRLHAAGSSLLDEPAARLDAVRPGIALYRGAVRVSTRLVEVRGSSGPAGYSRFESSTGHHGVILAGYSNGLRRGPCVVNGRRSVVREVGMQSSFVEVVEADRKGDEVVLLGDDLPLEDLAPEWDSSPHEVLLRLCGTGLRQYAAAP